jgi:hypothetical protein
MPMIAAPPDRPGNPRAGAFGRCYGPPCGAAVGESDPASEIVADGRGVGSTVGLGVGVATAVGVYVGRRSGAP